MTCSQSSCSCAEPCGRLLPLWDEHRVRLLSTHPLVSRVVAIGTLLAAELDSGMANVEGTTGKYGSGGLAVEASVRLRRDHNVFTRPLGPVLYLMLPPNTSRSVGQLDLEHKVWSLLVMQ